jgi:hypothetical protein
VIITGGTPGEQLYWSGPWMQFSAPTGRLRAAGHDCAHVYELGLGGHPDEQIMALADREDRILISADTHYLLREFLANAPVLAPSVILIRRADKRAGSLAAAPRSSSGTSSSLLGTWPQAC